MPHQLFIDRHHGYNTIPFMKIKIVILMAVLVPAMVLSAEKKQSPEYYLSVLKKGGDTKEVVQASRWAGKNRSKEAVEHLLVLLDDKRAQVRVEAASALGLIKDESVLPSLHNTLLHDQVSSVRYAALLAVLHIGSETSLEPLKSCRRREKDPVMVDLLMKLEKQASKGKR